MRYAWDRLERNEIYATEHDEARTARYGLSELQRNAACGHSTRNRRIECYDCDDRGDE
jgi:hypothetical protein